MTIVIKQFRGRRRLKVGNGERAEKNAHHVTFDKVKPERHLLNSLVNAVDTLFRIREDNVGFLVVACQHALFPTQEDCVS